MFREMLLDLRITHNPTTDAVTEINHVAAYRLPEKEVVKAAKAFNSSLNLASKSLILSYCLFQTPPPCFLKDPHAFNETNLLVRIFPNPALNPSPSRSRQHVFASYLSTSAST